MNKSKEKIKENPIVANRAIYMANPCHIIDKVGVSGFPRLASFLLSV